MNIFYTISTFLIILGLILIVPFLIALTTSGLKSDEAISFILTILLSLIVGWAGKWFFRAGKSEPLKIADSFIVVGSTWLILTFFGSLPLYFSGVCSFTDAYFETMSGFTTTGASIFPSPESLPRGLLFWRSFTQWLGGIGIIILALVILPALGIGGYQLFKLEAPGGGISPLQREKLKPRFSEIAKILWRVYILLTGLLVILLLICGLSLFDSICHSFTTLATGGFSTKSASIGSFNNYVIYVITIFMFLAACNFQTHYQVLRGNFKTLANDKQLKSFIIIIFFTVAIVSISHIIQHKTYQIIRSDLILRDSIFQVVSMISCTGFATTDFNQWPDVARFLLLIMMFIGGCAGSTAGGLKQIRLLVLLQVAKHEFQKLLKPHQVFSVKIGNLTLEKDDVANIMGFFFLYILVAFGTSSILIMSGLDIISAISAVLSTMGGVGPGLGSVAIDYHTVSVLGKWVLVFCMLAGRLELFCIIIIPLAWQKR
jgi:trk system potassium uptake protein TrkH